MLIKKYILPIAIISSLFFFTSCDSNKPSKAKTEEHGEAGHEEEGEHEENVVKISKMQDEVLKLKFDHLKTMNLSQFVTTTGKLQVPPENQASISSAIGANVVSILVSEGDMVKKGQILATLSHPDLIQLQVDYQESINQLEYTKKDFERQEMLLKNNVASGKKFQQVKSEYFSLKAKSKGLEAKLALLNINPETIKNGMILNTIPVIAAIGGSVSAVEVNLGKYVEPQTELFEILNTSKLHADLKVFESDIVKLEKGQNVIFQLNNESIKTYSARVTSIGKSFSENPRAITVHATIDANYQELIPGIFITGKIITGEEELLAIPEEAVVVEGDKSFIFILDNDHEEEGHEHGGNGDGHKEEKDHDHGEKGHDGGEKVSLKMIEVLTGVKDRGYIEVKPLVKLDSEALIAQNAAYYLLSEMKKGEAEHSH
ncbi:efflux RND transporter periplasmic adaptor subunit [Ancylomarina sp. DW003]|nr:efflux RND transporter periplasmic adaptor subunit [Ancylomarina sp. DW003]MDE5423686.1 efflux RND transporter periplasmic adaptor subunit [Ancylomarina sp. DW003]